jgi:signal peptidase I
MSSRLGQEIGRIAVLFSSLYVIQEYGVAVSMTVGPSMMPTFNSHGDIVIVNRSMQARFAPAPPFLHTSHSAIHLLQLFPNYKAGDVIIACNPNDPSTIVCKRIIAMPREKVYAQPSLCDPPIPSYAWFCQARANCLQMGGIPAHHRSRGPRLASGRQQG